MRALASAALCVVLAACGAKTGLGLEPICESASECPTPDWCAGVPACVYGRCVLGPAPDCNDHRVCTTDACDPAARACTHAVRDRDGDGYGDGSCGGPDCNDADPAVHPGATELCTGGVDEDCDLHVDCSDSDCASDPVCRTCRPEVCTGGLDEDCDLHVDCLDSDCYGDPACCLPTETRCTNARDDDCDGLVDCLDPDCAHTRDCCEPTPEVCNDLDDDCDGVVDDGVTCYTFDGIRIDPVTSATCGGDWYAYGRPSTASANPVPDVRVLGGVAVAVQLGPASCGGATVAVIADMVANGRGGSLHGSFVPSPSVASPVVVSDDPGECRYDGVGTVTCNWTWQPCCTDGVLLGPFPGDFCVRGELSGARNVDHVAVYGGAAPITTSDLTAPFEVCAVTIPAVP